MKPLRVIGFLAGYNIVQNTLLRERGYVPGNLAATALGLLWARQADVDLADAGLGRGRLRSGLVLGAAVAVPLTAAALAIRNQPRATVVLQDERLDGVSSGEAWHRVLVRFPLGTALFEEVWFRCLLPAALRRHGVARPELTSAGMFAAWHLIPTNAALSATQDTESTSVTRRTVLVAAGSAAAGVAGLGFSALRQMSGSLAAPWLVHAAANALTFAIALQARHKRENPGS